MKYDLEERAGKFGENTILFVKGVKKDDINWSIIIQLVRSSTSIGANYMEANAASSKKDFRNKISICRKEANESKHWLRMIAKTNPEHDNTCRKMWKESHELTLIFSKIFKNSQVKN